MSETIESRRKRLRFRSWHRGWRETDLFLGRFADTYLAGFGDAELDLYERLIEEADPDLFAWATGQEAAPAHLQSPVLTLLLAFQIELPKT